MSDTSAPPVILGDEPGSFPHSVLAERHPAIIEQVREAFPYGPDIQRRLDALLDNCAKGVIEPLPADAPDRDRWRTWGLDAYIGRSWFEVPWLWSESYFYRQLLDAVGYFVSGAWQGIDPFRPFKLAELDAPETDEELAVLDALEGRPVDERARALLHGSLWGNRADLGFRLSDVEAEKRAAVTGLVADDSETLWSLLPPSGTGTGAETGGESALRVGTGTGTGAGTGTGTGSGTTGTPARTLCLVADNAGRELIPDLLLAGHLLAHGRCGRVVFHVKPYPYYVSDATTADVVDALRKLKVARGVAAEHGRRLWAAMTDGTLTVRAHPFSAAPLPYAAMPDDLRAEFAAAALTIVKGDLNYRRLVGDSRWDPTTSFAEVTAGFPGPVAALRTLKSEVITGLAPDTEAALVAAEGQRWRTGGTHALIQVRE
ncbi:damage-control phosphatase ARMT1 family protein [Streptomyces maremycinicus]|uniref:damage-control phosphatase ARMT1 family protein n=1 Tax=Streptomyces maremycinicus TaxID=1679753 RepID=UPI000789957D|nr:damage-control phosphatase ARMT1 family protein [Streptomyces sp. NBRC 110468]